MIIQIVQSLSGCEYAHHVFRFVVEGNTFKAERVLSEIYNRFSNNVNINNNINIKRKRNDEKPEPKRDLKKKKFNKRDEDDSDFIMFDKLSDQEVRFLNGIIDDFITKKKKISLSTLVESKLCNEWEECSTYGKQKIPAKFFQEFVDFEDESFRNARSNLRLSRSPSCKCDACNLKCYGNSNLCIGCWYQKFYKRGAPLLVFVSERRWFFAFNKEDYTNFHFEETIGIPKGNFLFEDDLSFEEDDIEHDESDQEIDNYQSLNCDDLDNDLVDEIDEVPKLNIGEMVEKSSQPTCVMDGQNIPSLDVDENALIKLQEMSLDNLNTIPIPTTFEQAIMIIKQFQEIDLLATHYSYKEWISKDMEFVEEHDHNKFRALLDNGEIETKKRAHSIISKKWYKSFQESTIQQGNSSSQKI